MELNSICVGGIYLIGYLFSLGRRSLECVRHLNSCNCVVIVFFFFFNKLKGFPQGIIQSLSSAYVDVVLSMVIPQVAQHKNQQQAYVVDVWDILL